MREVIVGDESFELEEGEILVFCPECGAINQITSNGYLIEECFECETGFAVEKAILVKENQ